MKKNFSKRSRFFSLICYDDPLECFTLLISRCEHYAFIYHDNDKHKDGSLKEPHYHLLLCLRNAMTGTAVLASHTSKQTVTLEYGSDRFALFRYLTHKDNPEKYQYDEKNIISDNINYWLSLAPSPYSANGEKYLQLLTDIHNKLSFRDLVGIYGRDVMIHWDTYVIWSAKVFGESATINDVDDLAILECPPDDFPF